MKDKIKVLQEPEIMIINFILKTYCFVFHFFNPKQAKYFHTIDKLCNTQFQRLHLGDQALGVRHLAHF